jgi:glycosyltransferase involved in cell wall biosynthesis
MSQAKPVYLFILPWEPHHVGGVTNVVNNLARVMHERGSFTPKIAVNKYGAARPHDEKLYALFDFSIVLAPTPLGLLKACLRAPARLARTFRLLRANHVRVVNFHYPGLAPLGVAVLKRLGLFSGRLLLSYHGTDVAPPSGRIERTLRALIHDTAESLVACSNSLAGRMVHDFAVTASKVEVIFNGVDEDTFRPDGSPPSPRVQMPEWYVMSVGSFIPRKNHALLIEAFARVAPRYPELHLCIAGADGSERPAIEAAIERNGLAARVHIFLDLSQTDVAALLSRAAVCIQTSLAESFPLALLEAAASGTPLVASDIPGHDELIHGNVTGLLFPPGDAAACATAIAAMLDDPGSASAMAAVQRERVRTRFTLTSCLHEYEKLAALG